MTTSLGALTSELREIVNDRESDNFAQRFDEGIARIAELEDPAIIVALLEFVDDRIDDELVFSLVHTIEVFDAETYVPELLKGFTDLATRSSRWAGILILSVLNDPESLAVLAKMVNDGLEMRASKSLSSILLGLMREEPEFTDRVMPLLAHLPETPSAPIEL